MTIPKVDSLGLRQWGDIVFKSPGFRECDNGRKLTFILGKSRGIDITAIDMWEMI